MKNVKLLLILLLSGIACKAQEKNADPLTEARRAIAESNAIYFTAFEKNDATLFIERYSNDCCIMAPGAPAVCGPEAAGKFFRMAYDQFGLRNGRFITQEIFGDGREYVIETGLWESYNADGELYDNGKFLVLWKKTAEGWKMYRDSFSSNRSQTN